MSDVIATIYVLVGFTPILTLHGLGIISEGIAALLMLVVAILIFVIRWKQLENIEGEETRTARTRGGEHGKN